MQIEHMDQSFFLAGRLADNGQYDDAIVVLRPLVECELDDFHKTMVCVNLAILFGLKGQAADALAWYDRAINYERPHGRYFAAERKAAFMSEQGWTADSLALFRQILAEPALTDEDGERIRQNISILNERLS